MIVKAAHATHKGDWLGQARARPCLSHKLNAVDLSVETFQPGKYMKSGYSTRMCNIALLNDQLARTVCIPKKTRSILAQGQVKQ